MIIRLMPYYVYSFTFKHSFKNLKLHYYIYTFMFKTISHNVIQSILQVWDLKLTFNSRTSKTRELRIWLFSDGYQEKYL